VVSWPAARAAILAAVGAIAGAIAVVFAYNWHPVLAFEMDRDPPRSLAAGFYPVERSGELTFAWTSRRADIKLPPVNRNRDWVCALRFRGARSDPSTQPVVDIAVDGISAASVTATNDFQDVEVPLGAKGSAQGTVVTLTSSRTIVPGPSDSRELGIQVDRIACRPAGGLLSVPPSPTVRDSAIASAVFGAAFALAGVSVPLAAAATVLVAVTQSVPLSTGPAPYLGFAGDMVWFAVWIALVMVAVVKVLERWAAPDFRLKAEATRETPEVTRPTPARIAVMVSAAALYLKLLGLLHPSKLPIDAVFHAHRLEWVMSGTYFFTQPMPGGVSFPYAIGLYLFAAPWSVFTRDHVTLLRVVVCTAEIVAGALLYPLIVKAWNDRIAAACAVVLFSLVPLVYGLVGNANLTNAFAEAVALATIATVSIMPSRSYWALGVFFLLSSLAFLSHVSTFALLGVTLTMLCILYRWRGGPPLRWTAWSVAAVTIAAGLFAFLLYYGHFIDVYKTALRVRADNAASSIQNAAPASSALAVRSLGQRVFDALGFAVAAIGWPMWILALVGGWRLWKDGARDRGAFAVLAWGITCAAFLGVAVMRVDAPFQRYADEFFGRVLLATSPAVVILAARGASRGWRHGRPGRIASAVLLFCCLALGFRSWLSWFSS
jgi:hypothetical protein